MINRDINIGFLSPVILKYKCKQNQNRFRSQNNHIEYLIIVSNLTKKLKSGKKIRPNSIREWNTLWNLNQIQSICGSSWMCIRCKWNSSIRGLHSWRFVGRRCWMSRQLFSSLIIGCTFCKSFFFLAIKNGKKLIGYFAFSVKSECFKNINFTLVTFTMFKNPILEICFTWI